MVPSRSRVRVAVHRLPTPRQCCPRRHDNSVSPEQRLLSRDDFVPEGIFDNIWRHCWLSQLGCGVGGATGIEWVEARDAVTYVAMRRTVPRAKNYCVQVVNSAVAGKLRSRVTLM